MLRKLLLTGIFILSASLSAFAQNGAITGTVTNAKTGGTLPGTNVYIQSLNVGNTAGQNGNYRIENIPTGTYTLKASFVGFTTYSQKVTVTSGTKTINIKLQPSTASLQNVVVTGYGEVNRKQFTGSPVTVNSQDIEDAPVSSVTEALQGKTAGANISAVSGAPGAVQDIRIRGVSSINAGSDPLYVIDGVPLPSGDVSSFGATGTLSSLASLSPDDIESITVLKGATGTALYGARGSNGVIVIKTKSGLKNGPTQYSLSAQAGFNKPAVPFPDMMNTTQFNNFTKAATANNPNIGTPLSLPQLGDALNADLGSLDNNTDWVDIIHRNYAAQQKFGLSASGGNENGSFFASGHYFKQDGQIIGQGLHRINGKFNITREFSSNLHFKNNFLGSYLNQERELTGSAYFGSPFATAFFALPSYAAFNPDGSLNLNTGSNFNPIYIINNDIDRTNSYRLRNNTGITLDILDNLSVKTNFAFDFQEVEDKSYDNPNYGDGESTHGRVDDGNDREFNYDWKSTLKYIWSINQNNTLNIRGIAESQRNYHRYLEGYATGVASTGLFNLNTTSSPKGTFGYTNDWAIQSFSGLVNYNFQDKLFIDGSIRYEGSSRFAPDVRWGTFYSIGASYVLTEDLITDVDWLNSLKVRAAYGKTGNSSIDLNQYQSTVAYGSYANQSVIDIGNLGNIDLTWENLYQYDAGVDFKVFNRINGTVNVYRKNSTHLLFDVPLSYTSGFESQTRNNGKLYNQGIEVDLSAQIINRSNFAWKLGGNFTTNKNEVTALPKKPNGGYRDNITGTRYYAEVGYPVRSWYMREWAGVDPQNGDPLWYKDDGNGGRTTTNNYNKADRYFLGTPRPNKFGGLNTRINLFGFYVNADLYYAFDFKVYDDWALYYRSDGARFPVSNMYASQTNFWKEPGDHVPNPKPIYGGNKNSNATSSRYLYNGNYLRLKTLQIGYHLPARFLQNLGLTETTIYFLGQNLWTHIFDDALEFDPAQGTDGFTDLHTYSLRSITFGIKAHF